MAGSQRAPGNRADMVSGRVAVRLCPRCWGPLSVPSGPARPAPGGGGTLCSRRPTRACSEAAATAPRGLERAWGKQGLLHLASAWGGHFLSQAICFLAASSASSCAAPPSLPRPPSQAAPAGQRPWTLALARAPPSGPGPGPPPGALLCRELPGCSADWRDSCFIFPSGSWALLTSPLCR